MPYSTRFYIGTLTDALAVLYTVPASYVAVVRDISLLNSSGGTDYCQIGAEVPGPLSAAIYRSDAVPNLGFTYWQGRQVLNAGDELYGITGAGEWYATISGYLLSSS